MTNLPQTTARLDAEHIAELDALLANYADIYALYHAEGFNCPITAFRAALDTDSMRTLLVRQKRGELDVNYQPVKVEAA